MSKIVPRGQRINHIQDENNIILLYCTFSYPGGGGGVLPYMGYIGMCGPKGYGLSAVLVMNRVSILEISAILS